MIKEMSLIHVRYMTKVLELAKSRYGFVSPNPYVACIMTIDDIIVSSGVHLGAGFPHAEIEAFNNLPLCYDRSVITVYVNLEPCCHYNKRTSPCAQFLIKNGFRNIVIGCLDPNPSVSGMGVKLLKEAGLNVILGVKQKECEKLNKIFFKNMKTRRPFLYGKIGCSFDGRISLENGDSKWITSVESRKKTHELRLLYDAILVGKDTFLHDSPKLNTRLGEKVVKNNKKIILGNYQDIVELIPEEDIEQYIIISKGKSISKTKINGVTILFFLHDFSDILPSLFDLGICSIFVEGGGKVFSTFLEKKLFDEISIFKSPTLIGNGRGFSDSINTNCLQNMIRIKNPQYEILGNDIHLSGEL